MCESSILAAQRRDDHEPAGGLAVGGIGQQHRHSGRCGGLPSRPSVSYQREVGLNLSARCGLCTFLSKCSFEI